MKRIIINNFANGMADDRFGGLPSEASLIKHFDVLSHPRRLQPLRAMGADTTGTAIGNIIVSSNGLLYGIGTDPNNPTKGKLWQRSGYGATDVWQSVPVTNQLAGQDVVYDFLVENPDAGQIRTMYWAALNLLVASDPAGGSTAATQALTFATMGQGLLHPKYNTIFFPYKTTTTHYVGQIANSGTAFGGLTSTAFSLPTLYRAYCLSYYGDLLAIPMTSVNGIGVNGSVVGLWDTVAGNTNYSQIIPWGAGSLQVLNNLNGVLIGVNTLSANYTGSFQDYDAIQIKVWAGGAEPTLVKEIKAIHLAPPGGGGTHPTCSINPRVNFIYNNRLYFSVNVVVNDSIQPSWYGLWSVGKNKQTGEWTVALERVATNDNSETGVIAAAITGDFVSMVHTAVGTLTASVNGQTAGAYGATSVYESVVNPGMSDDDKVLQKKLHSIAVKCLPLPSGVQSPQIVLKYRVDSNGGSSDWITAYTYTTVGGVQFEAPKPSSGFYTDGYNYEFRLESTGGAVITALAYKYTTLTSNI